MAKRSIAGFRPSRVKTSETLYTAADIAQIVEVGGGLPDGQVEIRRLTAFGPGFKTVTIDRRTALTEELKSAAEYWEKLRHFQTEPTEQQIMERHHRIDRALQRLLKALDLPEQGGLEDMLPAVRFGPLYVEAGDELDRALQAVQRLAHWSRLAADQDVELQSKRHEGDLALDVLFRSLIRIWVEIFEQEQATRETVRSDGTEQPAPMSAPGPGCVRTVSVL